MCEDEIVNSRNISGLIQRTLNKIDGRLVDHGKRVAFLMAGMLEAKGNIPQKDKQDICMVAMLHDIGAYKTEEINRLLQFEVNDVWEHSIYGYLFLHHLSPLKKWAELVLFHHVALGEFPKGHEDIRELAQMLHLADRIDIFCRLDTSKEQILSYLSKVRGIRFLESAVDLFLAADRQFHLLEQMKAPGGTDDVLSDLSLSEGESECYLKMLIFSIDFRSQHTVTHTMTTASISCSVANLMGVPQAMINRIYYGALLHDLGKIGIPVEILEYPGKLSSRAMEIMRTHVDITEEILGGTVARDVTDIALRHHEKMDGSGYPRGLSSGDTTLEEQIMAVSDITSALLGTRSYKEAFSKGRTLSLLREQAEEGKLNARVVSVIEQNFDKIVDDIYESCTPILEVYYGIHNEYRKLLTKYL